MSWSQTKPKMNTSCLSSLRSLFELSDTEHRSFTPCLGYPCFCESYGVNVSPIVTMGKWHQHSGTEYPVASSIEHLGLVLITPTTHELFEFSVCIRICIYNIH